MPLRRLQEEAAEAGPGAALGLAQGPALRENFLEGRLGSGDLSVGMGKAAV